MGFLRFQVVLRGSRKPQMRLQDGGGGGGERYGWIPPGDFLGSSLNRLGKGSRFGEHRGGASKVGGPRLGLTLHITNFGLEIIGIDVIMISATSPVFPVIVSDVTHFFLAILGSRKVPLAMSKMISS